MSRPSSRATTTTEYAFLLEENKRQRKKFIAKWCIISTLILFFTLLLVFLVVFLGIPLVFKYSKDLQRSWIFPRLNLQPSDPEFENFQKYELLGARNMNYTIHSEENGNVVLGIWHILPENLIEYSIYKKNFDYENELARSEIPVLLYFHGTGGNRIKYVHMYRVLRRFFHVIAFDYRGYGDSSDVDPTEETIVQDSLKLSIRLQSQTRADIYFWGHGLGAFVATRTAAALINGKKTKKMPAGLFLEAPFTTLREELEHSKFYKIFSWLPWFSSMMLDPMEENGFHFRTTAYINRVDCPIMILHSEDDEIVPFALGEKLYNITQEVRNSFQGNVTFYKIPRKYHVGHYGTCMVRNLPLTIQEHIAVCQKYNEVPNTTIQEEIPIPEGHIYF